MYCRECGKVASGHFCSHCGAQLVTNASGETSHSDWFDEYRYAVLIRMPQVRDLIATSAEQSKKGMSADSFLNICDSVFAPLTNVSLSAVATVVVPLYRAIGIKTGKTQQQGFSSPVGSTIVAVVCSLAGRGLPLDQVEQGLDGCVILAKIPSDMWTFGGDLAITVERRDLGSAVEAAAVVKGQLYDWGKSRQVVSQLLSDIQDFRV